MTWYRHYFQEHAIPAHRNMMEDVPAYWHCAFGGLLGGVIRNELRYRPYTICLLAESSSRLLLPVSAFL